MENEIKRGRGNPGGVRGALTYKYRPVTRKLLEANNIEVIIAPHEPFGYIIKKDDRKIQINEAKEYYKSGGFKVSLRVNYYGIREENETSKGIYSIALGAVVFAWFVGEVPEYLVVDHIDNNPYNNSLSNLQLLSRSDNTKKNAVGHNHHTKVDDLVHKPIIDKSDEGEK